MNRLLIVSTLTLTLALAACGGESAQDRAQKQVCSARADIKKQVDALKSTTVSSASLDGVKANLSAIRKDLKQITSAQSDLKGDRKQAVQKANQTFRSQVAGVGQAVISGGASGSAQQQVEAALQDLASGYTSALAPLSCD